MFHSWEEVRRRDEDDAVCAVDGVLWDPELDMVDSFSVLPGVGMSSERGGKTLSPLSRTRWQACCHY